MPGPWLALLAVEALVGLGLVGFAATRVIGTQDGPQQRFDAWVAGPLLVAGAFGVALASAATIATLAARHRMAVVRTATAVAVVGGALAAVIGGADDQHRSHPQAFLRAAVDAFPLPVGAVSDEISVGPPPSTAVVALRPSGPPTGIRTWIMPAGSGGCGALARAVAGWPGAGPARALTPGYQVSCAWAVSYRGWPARTSLADGAGGGGVASLTVSPPGTD